MKRLTRFLLAIAVCLVVLSSFGLGGIWLGGHPYYLPTPIRKHFVADQDTQVINESVHRIQERYYRKPKRSDLADAAVHGMVEALDDRFSSYFNPSEYRRYTQALDSEFSGIGVTIQPEKRGLRVVEVYDSSPAKRAGIQPGDIVTHANGKSLARRPEQAASALIKGPAGTPVKLIWLRKGKQIQKTLIRSTISIPVVASRVLKAKNGRRVGYLILASFSSDAHSEVARALTKLKKQGAQSIIFDLRHNGGGLVTEAQQIASYFIAKGPIVTTRGRTQPTQTLRATGQTIIPNLPVAVLVDRDTASASEIVTGALQDYKRATIIGTRTFGKGVFQEIIELKNGGALDITAGQYFTPKGRNLGGRGTRTGTGIQPDIFVRTNPKARRDTTLAKALEFLSVK